MNRVVYGSTQQAESKKLKKLAGKITKVPDSIHIPSEYLVDLGDKS